MRASPLRAGMGNATAIGMSSSGVTVIELPGRDDPDAIRTVHLIGTAHVSRRSVEEVQEVIAAVKPDTVCIELCPMRYQTLTDESRWRKLDIFQVIRDGKVLFLMASLALQSFQRRLGDKLGVKPGAELLAGAQAAKEVGAELVLADRDVQVTLKRTWANVGLFNRFKLIAGLFAGMFEGEEIDEEQIEALKERDHISEVMNEFAKHMPEVKEPLIDERDQFLMSSIEDAPGQTIVAVVGAGHVAGMQKNVGQTIDRERLNQLPAPSKVTAILKWLIPILILSAFAYGYSKMEWKGLRYMLFAWFLPNAVMAGLFTLVARAKLLTVFVATLASPITSLNPTIGAGMFAGLMEAWLRKPTVEDCEKLGSDVTTFSAAMKNPVSHVLIVVIAASLGSSLGAYLGAAWVVKLLAGAG